MASWYGENRSRKVEPWNVGDIVRYDGGSTALMKIESIRRIGPDERGIACEVMYYGQHCMGGLFGTYHGKCVNASPEDLATWKRING